MRANVQKDPENWKITRRQIAEDHNISFESSLCSAYITSIGSNGYSHGCMPRNVSIYCLCLRDQPITAGTKEFTLTTKTTTTTIEEVESLGNASDFYSEDRDF